MTDPPRPRRAHAAAAARIGVVGVASSMTFGLVALMGSAAREAEAPATELLPASAPAAAPAVQPPPAPPIVIVVRRAVPAPGASAAAVPTAPRRTPAAAPVVAPPAPRPQSAPTPQPVTTSRAS